MRLLTIFLAAFLMLACGNSSTTKIDGKLPDGKLADGSGQLTCKQIASCLMTCATNATCISTCENKGCTAAQTTIQALATCAISKCSANCLGGYTAACDACAKTSCATEYASCENQTC